MPLDPTDRRLLAALQRNGQATTESLGATLNLSPSQAGRRRQRLEADGTIAIPDSVDMGVRVDEDFIAAHRVN